MTISSFLIGTKLLTKRLLSRIWRSTDLPRYDSINTPRNSTCKHIISQFQLDGDVTGINISNIVEDSLRETNNLTSDVIFENLIVMGNIVVQDSIDTKTWSDFEDLLLKTEQNARITGNKKFLSGVLMPKVAIQSGKINDHALTEFVTLESDQQFPCK